MGMQFNEFKTSLANNQPPEILNQYALSLWYDAKGNWEEAHNIIQHSDDSTAAWIHAYLHRKEGDAGNAAYWYRLAGKKMPGIGLEKEWEEIVKAIL